MHTMWPVGDQGMDGGMVEARQRPSGAKKNITACEAKTHAIPLTCPGHATAVVRTVLVASIEEVRGG